MDRISGFFDVILCGYEAKLRVTDNEGSQNTASIQLAVMNGSWSMRGHDTLHNGRSPYVGTQTNNVKWKYDFNSLAFESSPAI